MIQVVDPRKIESGTFGLGSYVGYTVHTRSSKGKEVEVLRRYSDFEWLREMLVAEFPNIILAPMPPKHAVSEGKYDRIFLERRRIELEHFIRRVAVHPACVNSKALRTFLVLKAHEFQGVKKSSEKGVLDRMSESMSVMSAKLLIKAEDPKFTAVQQQVGEVGEMMSALHGTCEQAAKVEGSISVGFDKMSQAVDTLSESETELGPLLKLLAHACLDESHAVNDLGKALRQKPLILLSEHCRYTEVLTALLNRRNNIMLQNQLLRQDAKENTQAMDDARAGKGPGVMGSLMNQRSGKTDQQLADERVSKLEAERASLDEAISRSDKTLSNANAALTSDLSRFARQRNTDMNECFRSFAQAQIAYLSAAEARWGNLVEEAEALPGGGGGE